MLFEGTKGYFSNLERVKEGTGDKVGLALQFISQFLSGFIIAFAYNWKLTLIMMSLTPFLVVCGWFMSRIMAKAAAREMKKYAKAGAIAEEALSSIRTVVSFNGQERECSRYDRALAAAKIDGIMKSIWVGFGLAMTFLIMFASYCLAFWLGTDYVADGTMNASNILTAFFSVVMGSMALGQAGQQFAVIGTAQGAAAAILDIIDRVPDIDSYSTEGERPRDVKGHIVLKDVHFTYPTRADIPVLRGITLEALPGETVALVGASGCGKSTITQLLLRYYNPMSGQISIDGHDISSLNIEYLRKLIGVVSQEPVLFNCTIEENILYGNPDVTPSQMTAACRMANAENFISQLPQGYKTIVGERGTQLSGGQKQRIAIARALVRDPKILLLDEATSALDAESESIVQAALDKAAQGRTTIVIAHRLSTIKNASKIIAIKDGAIAEVGTHAELMVKQGLYYELVNAQVFTDLGEAKADYGRQTSVLSARSRRSSTSSGDGLKRTLSHETEDDSDSEDSLPPAGQQEDIKSATKRLKRDLEKEGAKAENLLTIVKHARPEWGYLILAILSSLIGGGVFPAFSQFFTEIIRVFSETDKDKMRRDGHMWALMFLVLGIVQGICFFTQVFFFGLSSERFTMRLRSRLFRNIMRMDIAYFDMPNHSTGKITTRLASDTPNVRSALDYRLGSVFSCVVSVSAGLGLAFYYGWQLALLLVAIFPLLGVGHGLQMKYLRGRLEKDKRETENAGKLALEAIENIRTVQALTLEKKFYQMFSDNLEEPHRTSTRKAMMQAVSYGFSNCIPYFLYAAAFRFGLFLILDKILLPMNVLKVLFAISFTSGSLGFASAYFPEYSKARLAAGIIFKMLAEHPKIDSMMQGGKIK
ncbi:multi-drug resistance protein 1, partial [Aphelenchoides avenae]